jgi:S-adenosylmethionine:tRNA ribosyltransferase-isomerase
VKIDQFDYDLPADRIAQEPAARRDAARLFLLARPPQTRDAPAAGAPAGVLPVPEAGRLLDEVPFHRFPDLLRPGDLVVLNDTRVRPLRLHARKASGGAVEILLLEPQPGDATWTCLLSTSKGIRAGARLLIADRLEAVVLADPAQGRAIVRLEGDERAEGDPIERHGVMPLPPYIRREPKDGRDALDRERYQTVYARHAGAVAAPTAGLHFTPEMLASLPARGVGVAALSLHVGPGTFLPVRAEEIEDHRVEPERFDLPRATAEAVRACRARGGRVVAVGTTVTRVLESRALTEGRVEPGAGWCDLVILPGHRFRAVDALLTNLHLPKSSLLLLVAAFAGRERVLAAYREARERGARFYSYGDAMFIAEGLAR